RHEVECGDEREPQRVDRDDDPRRPLPRAREAQRDQSSLPVHGPLTTAEPPLARAHKVESYIASASTGGIVNLPLVTTRTVYTTFFVSPAAYVPTASRSSARIVLY